ncbi:hypothetical protein POSPLADRAFT_1163810 [Postia placenta MAD-698-R-SB12]|uniref:Uncharacterized protein n=1 Tax=Postia placenta MAD-698-R-SB12 TaxID=670580 RepID=A0A1X6MH30_9APHY|nr:hypothetical protein POSPLADRAFT_1163810 [Postia placenta MAD-698-R-SB12]OSX55707.1 hypothetical protein POSPLADRAFT_1163810 [Postia placenta MAD-698-R-SB12]
MLLSLALSPFLYADDDASLHTTPGPPPSAPVARGLATHNGDSVSAASDASSPALCRPTVPLCVFPAHPSPHFLSPSVLHTPPDVPAPLYMPQPHYPRLPLPVPVHPLPHAHGRPPDADATVRRDLTSPASPSRPSVRYAAGDTRRENGRASAHPSRGRVQDTRRAARVTPARQTARAHRPMDVAALPAQRARPAPSPVIRVRGTCRTTHREIRRIAGLAARCAHPPVACRLPLPDAADSIDGPTVRHPAERSREAAVRPHPCQTRVLHSRGVLLLLASAKRASPLPYANPICAHVRPVTLSTRARIPSQRVAPAEYHRHLEFLSACVPVRLACERRAAGSYMYEAE